MKRVNRIFIVSKGKPFTASTYGWLRSHGFTKYVTVLSHGDDAKSYKWNYGGDIHIAPKFADNLSKKREWILDSFAKQGEWVFMMCDNVVDVTGIPYFIDDIKPSRLDFECRLNPELLLKEVNNDIKLAEEKKAGLVGYACNSNHFFRTKHYRDVGFVWGKMIAVKKGTMDWDHSQNDMDDYLLSATSLMHYGKVHINNYLFAVSKRFEKVGGNGSYENRIAGKQQASKYMIENYEGMFRYKNKKGHAKNSEVQIRFTNLKQVNEWRQKIGIVQ